MKIENEMDDGRGRVIGMIAAAHFLLSVASLFLVVSDSMSRFDGAGSAGLAETLLNGAFGVLTFPVLTPFLLLHVANTGMWAWLLVLSNSLLWGWVGWRVIRFRRSRNGRAAGTA